MATVVKDAEFETLLAQRLLLSPPLRHVHCELVVGHEDSHVAFVLAAEYGERWWWVRWDSTRHEVLALGVCPYTEPQEHDDCLLPVGHVGTHGFQLVVT
ncbi:hypothetical protein Ari01nite_41550 [Paractinoplanes rishiriensis]|uniref:Uncharacterized protein n=1 Tax=Paractinoplanes rishiriensis TaxID=1050105 RepID=A0A919JXJ7_9ACTN|nr:hypothetical protein Ari01nite_41550 [Actinoplanes rishiriensis]